MRLIIARIFFYIFLLCMLAAGLMESLYIVHAGEQVIVKRFDSKINCVSEPGLHFKIPFVDKSGRVDTSTSRRVLYDSEYSAGIGAYSTVFITGDGKLVNVKASVQYCVRDALLYSVNEKNCENIIARTLESALRRNIRCWNLDTLIDGGPCISPSLLSDIREEGKTFNLGVYIESVEIQSIKVPISVRKQWLDTLNAVEQKENMQKEGEQYKIERLLYARLEAYRMEKEAEQYKIDRILTARGEMEGFRKIYEVCKNNKEAVKKMLYIETMERILQRVKSKYIIDSSSNEIPGYQGTDPMTLP
jgi:membrane protease subunit HflK